MVFSVVVARSVVVVHESNWSLNTHHTPLHYCPINLYGYAHFILFESQTISYQFSLTYRLSSSRPDLYPS